MKGNPTLLSNNRSMCHVLFDFSDVMTLSLAYVMSIRLLVLYVKVASRMPTFVRSNWTVRLHQGKGILRGHSITWFSFLRKSC